MVSAKVERLRSHWQKCKVPTKECDWCLYNVCLCTKTQVLPSFTQENPGFTQVLTAGLGKTSKTQFLPTIRHFEWYQKSIWHA